MSILRNMSNLLFGVDRVSNEITNEPPRLLAKRMAKSSKLRLGDSDIKPLSVDPMSFDYHYYPQEVGQLGDGHYMKFHIFENVKSTIETPKALPKQKVPSIDDEVGKLKDKASKAIEKEGKNLLSGAVNNVQGYFFNKDGSSTDAVKEVINSVPSAAEVAKKASEINAKPRDKFESTHKRLSQSIILYTPPETKFGYKTNYTDAETGMLGGLAGAENFTQMMSAGGAGLANLLSSAMQIVSPGIGGLATRAFGKTTNPNMELAFESVPFRSFTYPFTFAPKNHQELQQVHKIIETFKFHMLPESSTPDKMGARTQEVDVCKNILASLGLKQFKPKVVSCPGCGRTSSNYFIELTKDINNHIENNMITWKSKYKNVENINIAVMGCIVNGPGESKHANIGISLPGTNESPSAPVYVDGEKVTTLRGDSIKEEFLNIIETYIVKNYERIN